LGTKYPERKKSNPMKKDWRKDWYNINRIKLVRLMVEGSH